MPLWGIMKVKLCIKAKLLQKRNGGYLASDVAVVELLKVPEK